MSSLKNRLEEYQKNGPRRFSPEIELTNETRIIKLRPEEKQVKNQIYRYLVEKLKNVDYSKGQKTLDFIETEAKQILNQETGISVFEKEIIIQELKDDIIGYGPITSLLANPKVSEIMVNGPDQIYFEKSGRLELAPLAFDDNEHVVKIIEKIVSPLGRRIDESNPMVDARLPDGSRVNAVIPPLAIDGANITIRKFPSSRLKMEDFVRFGTLSDQMAQFIEACVKARLNIIISGGTGSGKTTLLNICSAFIPENERIITIEDAAELQLAQPHVVRLETRPANIEGTGAVTIRDLVKNTLRMRPDRIVIGECRGGEALDMLQAMNTGHDGSLTTGHANSPRDMLSRLETMVLMAGMDLPIRAIREQISSAVDLVIQQSRMKDGSRKITSISEVVGLEGDIITLQDIYVYKQTGFDANGMLLGSHQAVGIRPNFMHKLVDMGIDIPMEWFL